jgi:hypothetical protein
MPNERLYTISFCEAWNEVIAVLPDTLDHIIGHSDVERAIPLVGENVNKEGHALSPWTPAFAG